MEEARRSCVKEMQGEDDSTWLKLGRLDSPMQENVGMLLA
jgi:hypothetical protein